MNRMTRKQAAKVLGVNPQTITNYVKEGILGGVKDVKGVQYINADDVVKYADKYKFIAVSQEMINNKIDEIKKLRNHVRNELAEVRKALFHNYRYGITSYTLARAISAIYEAGYIPNMKKREVEMLTDYLTGKDTRVIANEHVLSIERIQQILNKACRKIYEQTDVMEDNIRKGMEARREVEVLKDKLKILHQQYNEYRIQHKDKPFKIEPPKILSAKVVDFDLSVRVLNSLKGGDVETIGDMLLHYSSARGIKLRNLGKKSWKEIDEFVKSQGLFFIGKNESKEEYYERLNRALNHTTDEHNEEN